MTAVCHLGFLRIESVSDCLLVLSRIFDRGPISNLVAGLKVFRSVGGCEEKLTIQRIQVATTIVKATTTTSQRNQSNTNAVEV